MSGTLRLTAKGSELGSQCLAAPASPSGLESPLGLLRRQVWAQGMESRGFCEACLFFFCSRTFFIQKSKNVFQPHTGGYGLGAEVSVHPVWAPHPCGFSSNKVWGNGPKIKMVCVVGSVVGSRGVQKHWGVVRGGLDEVSTGNAAGERPFHNISY